MTNERATAYYATRPSAQWAILGILVVSNLQGSLTFAAINVALPAIGAQFESSALLLAWLPTGFLLANATLLLPFGFLGDRAGRKRTWMAGVALFGAGSVVALLAGSMPTLIFARVLQGIGVAMSQACGIALLFAVFPSGRRGLAIGCYTGSIYIGLSGGPFLGGLLTEFLSWRYIFSFQIPVTAIVLALTAAVFRGEWRSRAGEKFDWAGATLFAFAVTCLVYGMSSLPEPASLVSLALVVLVGYVFVRHQLAVPEPLLRLRRIRANVALDRALVRALCLHCANYPVAILLSVYIQAALGLTPTQTGLLLLSQAGAMTLVAPVAGRLSDIRPAATIAVAGGAVVVVALLLLLGPGMGGSTVTIAAGLALLGVGMSLFSTPNQNATLAAVPESRIGAAGALSNQARTLGNVFGMGVSLLAVAAFVGDAEVSAETVPSLRMAVRSTLITGICVAVFAIAYSVFRGRRRTPRAGGPNRDAATRAGAGGEVGR